MFEQLKIMHLLRKITPSHASYKIVCLNHETDADDSLQLSSNILAPTYLYTTEAIFMKLQALSVLKIRYASGKVLEFMGESQDGEDEARRVVKRTGAGIVSITNFVIMEDTRGNG
jgi:hypothetical protein